MIQLSTINQQTVQQGETIELAAVVETALCVGAGGSSGSLADKPILKNSQGQLVIPASQVKGRLRHECEKLVRSLQWPVCKSPVATTMCPQRLGQSDTDFDLPSYRLREPIGQTHRDREPGYQPQTHCLICQLFGNPALPARLQFSDLVCTEPEENIPEVLRPGVSINRRRRTAEESKLYFLETSPANASLRFEGSIQLLPPWLLTEGEPIPFAKALILAGLQHIHALGGGKSTGLGWLHWQFPTADATDALEIPDSVWQWLGNAPKKSSTEPSTGTQTVGEDA
ncbi:RAMP superfamily CRISPR-associated protein [cf. Phormidesmis sp. LEGE 11477]|uniref:RAMP superfamily CRISPR-associated protein n=1 Tax=cf. Phormidesmis sp. LEGE 11477 TaxID=1828680 RepID=UPI00187E989F|nr:RAMP superfamily CRISPR-associated protein [cf. Phormidesmis sp. LEGE 11477]MBE9063119.1 CRISPR-associated protein Csm3 [cf. Phormidesmis sp. LEGE 11477]